MDLGGNVICPHTASIYSKSSAYTLERSLLSYNQKVVVWLKRTLSLSQKLISCLLYLLLYWYYQDCFLFLGFLGRMVNIIQIYSTGLEMDFPQILCYIHILLKRKGQFFFWDWDCFVEKALSKYGGRCCRVNRTDIRQTRVERNFLWISPWTLTQNLIYLIMYYQTKFNNLINNHWLLTNLLKTEYETDMKG